MIALDDGYALLITDLQHEYICIYIGGRDINSLGPASQGKNLKKLAQGGHEGPAHEGPANKGPAHEGPAHEGPVHKGPAHKYIYIYIWQLPICFFTLNSPLSSHRLLHVFCAGFSLCYVRDEVCVMCGL